MKSFFTMLAAGSAVLLSGCAYEAYGPPPPYGTAAGVSVDYYDGYYDGYYGPFYDGYWGPGGYFYYSDARGHWRRDDGHHFRHDASRGWSHVHGHAPPRNRRH